MNLVQIADEAFQRARTLAGPLITCHAGCDECCRRPFAITEDDAARLREGLANVPSRVASAIEARAEFAWSVMAADFPGESSRGALTRSEEWREWFFARHSGLACPALDAESGSCLLYHHRPICCRIYGPLIEISGQTSDPCRLCFPGASPETIESTRVVVNLPSEAPHTVETLIAFALSPSSMRRPQSGPTAPQSV